MTLQPEKKNERGARNRRIYRPWSRERKNRRFGSPFFVASLLLHVFIFLLFPLLLTPKQQEPFPRIAESFRPIYLLQFIIGGKISPLKQKGRKIKERKKSIHRKQAKKKKRVPKEPSPPRAVFVSTSEFKKMLPPPERKIIKALPPSLPVSTPSPSPAKPQRFPVASKMPITAPVRSAQTGFRISMQIDYPTTHSSSPLKTKLVATAEKQEKKRKLKIRSFSLLKKPTRFVLTAPQTIHPKRSMFLNQPTPSVKNIVVAQLASTTGRREVAETGSLERKKKASPIIRSAQTDSKITRQINYSTSRTSSPSAAKTAGTTQKQEKKRKLNTPLLFLPQKESFSKISPAREIRQKRLAYLTTSLSRNIAIKQLAPEKEMPSPDETPSLSFGLDSPGKKETSPSSQPVEFISSDRKQPVSNIIKSVEKGFLKAGHDNDTKSPIVPSDFHKESSYLKKSDRLPPTSDFGLEVNKNISDTEFSPIKDRSAGFKVAIPSLFAPSARLTSKNISSPRRGRISRKLTTQVVEFTGKQGFTDSSHPPAAEAVGRKKISLSAFYPSQTFLRGGKGTDLSLSKQEFLEGKNIGKKIRYQAESPTNLAFLTPDEGQKRIRYIPQSTSFRKKRLDKKVYESFVIPPKREKTHWTSFMNNHFLNKNPVNEILLTSQGKLWAGIEGGILKYSGSRWEFFQSAGRLPGEEVLSMEEAADGNLWVGTENGLAQLDQSGNRISLSDGLSGAIFDIHIDKTGTVWAGTDSGLFRYNENRWEEVKTPQKIMEASVKSIVDGPDGRIWIGTDKGLCMYDGKKWTHYNNKDGLVHDNIYSLAVDKNGILWCGTEEGVSRFDGKNWQSYTKADGLADNEVYKVKADSQGNIWFGTRAGVSKFNNYRFTNYDRADGLLGHYVYSIAIAGSGEYWFGTERGVSKMMDIN